MRIHKLPKHIRRKAKNSEYVLCPLCKYERRNIIGELRSDYLCQCINCNTIYTENGKFINIEYKEDYTLELETAHESFMKSKD